MPAIQPGSLVLVTGASGFIAVHLVKTLLEQGYPVRGTVRSKEKGEYLKNFFKDSKVPFEYVIVKDIAEPNAFDEAVKDVVGVAHTASPFHFKVEDPQELIGPAVKGTVGVLDSIKKNNPNVQRVVITSSVASVVDESFTRPHVFDEKNWNEFSPKLVEEKGKDAPTPDMYRASKTLAERAFWKWIEDNKPSWDGATVNPPMVFGPILQQISSVSDLNTSNANLYSWLTQNHSASEFSDFAPFNWVDVRDVALAHARALVVPEASGQRFITSAGPAGPNDLCVAFGKLFPDRDTYPKGDASALEKQHANSNRFLGGKAEKVLGVKYHDLETSIKDSVESFVKRLGV